MSTLQPADHWTRTLEWTPPRRRPLADRVFDGEAVLYDAVTGQTHRLNQTALFVWRACDGERTTVAIARMLTEHYDVRFETAIEDVEQILAALAQADLLATGGADR